MVCFPGWRDKLNEARRLRSLACKGKADAAEVRLSCAELLASICADTEFIEWVRQYRSRLADLLHASGAEADALRFIALQLLIDVTYDDD